MNCKCLHEEVCQHQGKIRIALAFIVKGSSYEGEDVFRKAEWKKCDKFIREICRFYKPKGKK